MAVFIELVTEPFTKVFQSAKGDGLRTRGAGASSVRRPLRGLEVKDDTYAVIKVIQADGTPIPLIDSGHEDGLNDSFSNFILQSVREARMEKHQLVETFGDSYIFFFGESPRFLDFTAVLLNSHDFNWEAEFWENYEQFFRGSKLTELGARIYMFYDDNVVEGYMLMAQAQKVETTPLWVQLNFRLFLTAYTNISFVGSEAFPVRSTVDLPPGVDLEDPHSFTTLLLNSQVESANRGFAEQNATLALQQQALSKFGGGALLAQALRGGLAPGSVGVGVGATAQAGVGFGASSVLGGVVQGGGGIFSTGSYPGFSPVGGPGASASASASASAGGGGAFASASASAGVVSGPGGEGAFTASAFASAGASAGLPSAGAPLGTNPFAPNPFAPPNSKTPFGVNPFNQGPFVATPFSPTGPFQPKNTRSNVFAANPFAPAGTQLPAYGFPRDSIFGPGFTPFSQTSQKKKPASFPAALTRTEPLRGLIRDNADEWTGAPPLDNNAVFDEPNDVSDVEDLPYASILMMGAYGASVSGIAGLGALGLSPRFQAAGVGIGAGVGFTASASFGISGGVGASFGASGGLGGGGIGYGASAGVGIGIGPNGPYAGSFSQSGTFNGPVFGGPPSYPGYPGFGSGYGSGFPGLNGGFSPGVGLGMGVSAGVSAGASFGGGYGVGAGVLVGGNSSAFSLDSYPGTLVAGGNAFLGPDGTITIDTFTSGPGGSSATHTVL